MTGNLIEKFVCVCIATRAARAQLIKLFDEIDPGRVFFSKENPRRPTLR